MEIQPNGMMSVLFYSTESAWERIPCTVQIRDGRISVEYKEKDDSAASYEGFEDGAAAALVEEDFVADQDVARFEGARIGSSGFDFGHEAIGSGEADSGSLGAHARASAAMSPGFIGLRIPADEVGGWWKSGYGIGMITCVLVGFSPHGTLWLLWVTRHCRLNSNFVRDGWNWKTRRRQPICILTC